MLEVQCRWDSPGTFWRYLTGVLKEYFFLRSVLRASLFLSSLHICKKNAKVLKENDDYAWVWTTLFYASATTDLWCQGLQKSYIVRLKPSFCSSLYLLMSVGPGLHTVPPGSQRHSPLCACQGSSALAAALPGTTPAQHSWPSATCSHLMLFVLAQLFLPKAPPEATWKMRSANWSALKINQEKKKQPKTFYQMVEKQLFQCPWHCR